MSGRQLGIKALRLVKHVAFAHPTVLEERRPYVQGNCNGLG